MAGAAMTLTPTGRATCDDCGKAVRDLYVMVPGKCWVCRACRNKRRATTNLTASGVHE